MTDNEIIKALECYLKNTTWDEYCSNSYFVTLVKNAFDLINRQKAEIESLKKEFGIGHICGDVVVHTKTLDDYYKFKKSIKAEAVKEVMEKLKRFLSEKCGNVVEDNPNLDEILFGYRIEEVDEYIDNLVKRNGR